jgi:PAS domain S-box-containing protein
MVIGLALVLVTGGTILFMRLTTPIVKHLTETEQRYQRIFRNAPVPIWEQDFSGVVEALQDLRTAGVSALEQYLDANPQQLQRLVGKVRLKEANGAALRLFGASSGRQFTTWFETSFVPTTLDMSVDKLQALWEGREALLTRTLAVQTLDGRDRTIILSIVIPSKDDGYHSALVSALDVTADVRLRRREQELDLIMASTGEGIFGMDSQGRCIFVNRAALRMLGYQDESQLLGRDMHSMVHHTCRNGTPLPREECPIYRARCQNTVVHLQDEELWRADGTSFPAEYRSYPMLRDGKVVGTVVNFTDITDRKERETQHIHAQKMQIMGRLTGGIAHDFNNLLTIILVNLRMLARRLEVKVDAETLELVDDALSAAEDGAAVTDRWLVFSRRQPAQPRLWDLNLLLRDLQRLLRRVTGDEIELIVHEAGNPLPVLIDPQQLENAILNLAINARDAMPEGGRLTIEAQHRHIDVAEPASHSVLKPGTYAVVSVTDTGIGMPTEAVKRAVEPFYTTKPPGKGSGLGLSVVLRFAQQAGGGLTIDSAPAQGTTVALFLPQVAIIRGEREEAPPLQPPADGAGKTATILVVEDDPRTRRLAARILSELGYRVLAADNAMAAIRILETDAGIIDLLFSDVVMPGAMDGRALGYWARRHHPALKVLLTSGFPEQVSDDLSLPLLEKPYSQEQLQEAIRTLL